MRHSLGWIVVLLGLTVVCAAAADDGWTRYRAPDYGFSMLVPAGTTMTEREWPGGWGGLYANHEGVELIAAALLGEQASAEEIEAFGVKVTKIAGDSWKLIDSGENAAGWTWYKTVKATSGGKVIYGGYGVSSKGSYLILLVTTAADFAAYQADYEHWYESVELE
jgi:uncharacterized protein YfiM (DUF2279 family)